MKYRPYKTNLEIANELLERACDEMMEKPPRNTDLLREAALRLSSSIQAAHPSALPAAPGGVTLPSPGHNFILTIPTDDPVAIRAVVTQLEEALVEHGTYTGVISTECGVDGFAVLS